MRTGNRTWYGVAKATLLAIGVLGGTLAWGKEELRLYIWTEYIDPEIIKDFEKQADCKVVQDYYESNEEMLAKLQAGGVSQYDLVVPSDFIMTSLINLKLLQPLDKTLVPNLANLKPRFTAAPFDPGNVYSAAYQWGTVGLVYNKNKVKDFDASWDILLGARATHPFLLFDSEREQIGVALKYLAASVNTLDKTELKKAADLLIAAKKNKACQGFEANIGGRNKVIAGAVDVAMAYSGDVFQGMREHPELAYAIPKEGTVVWVDSLAIPAKAPNAKLANRFINFILEAKTGARLSNFNHYATPNAASMAEIDPADLKNPTIYPDAEMEKRLEYVQDLGKNNQLYSELWKMIKTR